MDRYGDAIEFDLHKMGLDLLDWFRGRYRWAKLRRLIRHLGTGTAFWAARAGDEEAAEYYLKSGHEAKGTATPDLVDMTLTNQLLIQLVDLARVQSAKLDAIGGARPEPILPTPRPVTGLQKAKAKIEAEEEQALINEVYAAMDRFLEGE